MGLRLTLTRDIQISKPFETISLLSEKSLQKHKEKNFKYIHIGLVQIGFKPLTKEGLNTSIFVVLRDARFIDFEDSLLSYPNLVYIMVQLPLIVIQILLFL